MHSSEEARDGVAAVRRLLRCYAWRYRWSYLAGFCFLWLTNYLSVTIPVHIGRAVDALEHAAPLGAHIVAIAWMGLAVIGVRSLSRVLIFNPGRYVEYNLRQDLFAKLMRLQPAFFVKHQRGDIVSRAANDIGWVRTMVGYGGLQLVNVSVAVVLTTWKMLVISPRLMVVVMVPVVLGMTLVQWSIRRLFVLSRRNQEQLGEISEHVLGSLQGVATIQSYVAERAFERRFARRNGDWLQTGMKLALIRALALPLLVLSGGVALYLLVRVGGAMVLGGTLSLGELTAFTALLTVFLPPLRSLGWMLSVFQRGRSALERIFELMDAPLQRPEGSLGKVVRSGHGPALSLRHLSFAYPDEPEREVLHDLTIDIPAGAVVGLCGRTGSGKSTLLRVLARLFNPPVGAVLIDGDDVRSLDLDTWRRRLALVPQRPFLFSDTVAFNIGLSTQQDVAEVEEAARSAALDRDLQTLGDGLRTIVGERGIMLSGGQRQRVALARGLARDADLIMLDDVLSAVDQETEARLVTTLIAQARRPQAPTIIIASHRLAALRHSDMILVLDRGKLVQVGNHAALVSSPGVYRDTWQVQSSNGGPPVQTEVAL